MAAARVSHYPRVRACLSCYLCCLALGLMLTGCGGSQSGDALAVPIPVVPDPDDPLDPDQPPNEPPVVSDLPLVTAIVVRQGDSVDIVLSGSDPDGDPIDFRIEETPAQGSLSGVQLIDGQFVVTYTAPVSDFTGTVNFTYSAFDGIDRSAPGTVTITVTEINPPPFALDLLVGGQEDIPLDIGLPGGDLFQPFSELTYTILTLPASGTLTYNQTAITSAPISLPMLPAGATSVPAVTYIPDPDVNGSDSFTYQVNDGTFDSGIGTIRIRIAPINDPPRVTLTGVPTGPITTNELILQLTVNDPDTSGAVGGEVVVTWDLVDGPAQTLFIDPPSLRGVLSNSRPITLQFPRRGIYQLRVTVLDTSNASDDQLIEIDVQDPNFFTLEGAVSQNGTAKANRRTVLRWNPTRDATVFEMLTNPAGAYQYTELIGQPSEFRVAFPGIGQGGEE